jgi:hypothetical protein
MLANDRYDYLEDFPLSSYELEKDIAAKYPSNVYGIHHYEDADGFVVNSDYPSAISIDNITHEDRVNETKRTIKIVSKALIEQIMNEFTKLMKT